jgi:uncharacterized protein with PQ loop repeat
MTPVISVWLGLIAGATVTAAAIPRVLDIIRDADKAKGESYLRNGLMIAGNLMWVAYGVLSDALPVLIMCSLNSLLIGIILWAAVQVNRQR